MLWVPFYQALVTVAVFHFISYIYFFKVWFVSHRMTFITLTSSSGPFKIFVVISIERTSSLSWSSFLSFSLPFLRYSCCHSISSPLEWAYRHPRPNRHRSWVLQLKFKQGKLTYWTRITMYCDNWLRMSTTMILWSRDSHYMLHFIRRDFSLRRA